MLKYILKEPRTVGARNIEIWLWSNFIKSSSIYCHNSSFCHPFNINTLHLSDRCYISHLFDRPPAVRYRTTGECWWLERDSIEVTSVAPQAELQLSVEISVWYLAHFKKREFLLWGNSSHVESFKNALDLTWNNIWYTMCVIHVLWLLLIILFVIHNHHNSDYLIKNMLVALWIFFFESKFEFILQNIM